MRERDLDPKIDYSFFNTEDIVEPVQEAVLRNHRYCADQWVMKELHKEGFLSHE